MALTASAAAELQQLFRAVGDVQVANICSVAAAAWLAYDILLTLPQEISLVWSARWSMPKLLYFLVRYYTLLSLLLSIAVGTSRTVSVSFCRRWIWYNAYNGTLLTALLGEAIFLMRLYASYQRNKTILVIIVFLYTAELAVGVVTATLIVTSLEVMEAPVSLPLPGCHVTPPMHARLSTGAWIVAIATTCVYFLLILYKFANGISLKKSTNSASSPSIWELRTISPVVYSFIRDSAFYFFLVFAGNLMNLVFEIVFQGSALVVLSTVWLAAIYSISASRLCLNTRDSLQHPRYQYDTGWFDDIEPPEHSAATSVSHVQFLTQSSNGTPAIVFTQSGGEVSPQRTTFELKRDGSSNNRRPSDMTEDYELISIVHLRPPPNDLSRGSASTT